MYGRNLRAYQKTNLEAELSVADPHRIVQMMFEGLIERQAQIKGAIERKDYAYKADRSPRPSASSTACGPHLTARRIPSSTIACMRCTTTSRSLSTKPQWNCPWSRLTRLPG